MRNVILISLMALFLSACSSVSPEAGNEAVLTTHPVFGGGGIVEDPVKAGQREYVSLLTTASYVYVQPQKYEVQMDDTMTSDGVPIQFHAIVVLQITDSVTMVKKFGAGWYENNILEPFKTMVRQAVRKHGMNETAISTEALDAIDSEIKTQLEKFIKDKGIPAQLVTMTVGKANPPDAIKHQRTETAQQEQRINTELKRKLAEDNRLAAEQSRAAADNAYRESMHLSPEQFVELQKIKMQEEVCGEKGKATCIFSNGATPLLNVR